MPDHFVVDDGSEREADGSPGAEDESGANHEHPAKRQRLIWECSGQAAWLPEVPIR